MLLTSLDSVPHLQLLPSDRAPFSTEDGHDPCDRDDFDLPPGWVWRDVEWTVDMARAVDGDGWEYAFDYGRTYFPAKKLVRMIDVVYP